MLRRDLISLLLVTIWGLYVLFVLPNNHEPVALIANFACSLLALLVSLWTIIILCLTIKKFGKFCDHKIF